MSDWLIQEVAQELPLYFPLPRNSSYRRMEGLILEMHLNLVIHDIQSSWSLRRPKERVLAKEKLHLEVAIYPTPRVV